MRKILLEGNELFQRCKELGVSVARSGDGHGQDDSILQGRLLEYERSKREHRLWIVALVSAIASVISALAAWVAALSCNGS